MAGAACAKGSMAKIAETIRLVTVTCDTRIRPSSAGCAIGEFKSHHPVADEDKALRVHADASFGVRQGDDLVIGFRDGGSPLMKDAVMCSTSSLTDQVPHSV